MVLAAIQVYGIALLGVMVGADSVPELLKAKEDVAEGGVVREKLNLARTVKENVIFCWHNTISKSILTAPAA